MATGWGFIKRLGANRENRTSDRLILSDVQNFELSVDGEHDFSAPPSPAASSIFSLKSAASSVQSFSSFSPIKRLGSMRSLGAQSDRSSVMFDADELHSHIDETHSSREASSATRTPVVAASSRTNTVEPHVAPSGSALTFLERAKELGVRAAIDQEVGSRQKKKVEDFSDVWKAGGMEAAMRHAVSVITDQGRNGRPENANVTNALVAFNKNSASLDQAYRETFNIEQLQNYYHQDNRGANLNSGEIAENFERNGADLVAAELALAFIESGHDYIQANEINGSDRAMKRDLTKPPEPSAQLQKSRRGYEERSRDAGGVDR